MKNKSGIKISFNFFDIVIILVVIALVAGIFVIKNRSGSGAGQTDMKTVRYQVEITDLQTDIADLVAEGDAIVDKIKKLDMGSVVSCETYLMKKKAVDLNTGNTVFTEAPGIYAALITIEAECSETDSAVTASGGYEIRVGKEVSVLGPGYGGGGFIVNVERG